MTEELKVTSKERGGYDSTILFFFLLLVVIFTRFYKC